MSQVVGVVLAAGAGTRFGGPKALARTAAGEPWVERAVATLRRGGCSSVLVALGAGAADASPLVPGGADILVVPDWADGLSVTVRAALAAIAPGTADAALLVPVDTPDMPQEVCVRLIAAARGCADGEGAGGGGDATAAALARAVFDGVPGHPVLIGREHWSAVAERVAGDQGAGPYLRAHGATRVECGDLWDGADIDRPAHR